MSCVKDEAMGGMKRCREINFCITNSRPEWFSPSRRGAWQPRPQAQPMLTNALLRHISDSLSFNRSCLFKGFGVELMSQPLATKAFFSPQPELTWSEDTESPLSYARRRCKETCWSINTMFHGCQFGSCKVLGASPHVIGDSR